MCNDQQESDVQQPATAIVAQRSSEGRADRKSPSRCCRSVGVLDERFFCYAVLFTNLKCLKGCFILTKTHVFGCVTAMY